MAKLLTAREVAEMLGVSPHTVLDWYEAGKLPGYKLLGGVLRFKQDEIVEWVAAQKTGAP